MGKSNHTASAMTTRGDGVGVGGGALVRYDNQSKSIKTVAATANKKDTKEKHDYMQ